LGNSTEILKEHQETTDRDEFLARELVDLETSAASLRVLIEELTRTLETRFGTASTLSTRSSTNFLN